MNHSSRIRHRALRARMTGLAAAMLGAAMVLLAACRGDGGLDPERPLTYQITAGACGEVVFAESIGVDSASAISVIEARKAAQYGEGEVTLDPHPLEVVDEHGNRPEPSFYALHVLEADTEILVHSVAEVITTDGDLFDLVWCPD